MKQRVLTLMWGSAWRRYGRKFVASFQKHWPSDVELVIVTDRALPDVTATQVKLSDVPGYTEFMFNWRGDPRANGFGQKVRKLEDGRSWRHDAIKWAPQGLSAPVGLEGLDDGDLLCWLDADVETICDVPKSWINVLLAGSDLAGLFRGRQYPEIGFWAVRVGADTRAMISRFADSYRSGAVFKLPEQHSAFVFGEAVKATPGLAINNLNSAARRGHVWPYTALAQFTRHNKGKRKDK